MGLEDHAGQRQGLDLPVAVPGGPEDKLEQVAEGGAIGQEEPHVQRGGSEETGSAARRSPSLRSAAGPPRHN